MMYSKADTHIHTTYSDGRVTPQELIDFVVAETAMRVIAITDHDTTEGAFVARDYVFRRDLELEVVVGQEVTTDEGDIVGLFLHSTLPAYRTARRAIEAIHAQGGIAVAVHPFSGWATFGNMSGVGRRLLELPLDGVEVRNGFPTSFFGNWLTQWFNRRRTQTLCELGGSDSHVPFTVGQPYTYFPGQTSSDLRDAIVRGRTSVGGRLWRTGSIARAIPLLLERGLPERKQKPVYDEEAEQQLQPV
jgi:predicted metal-dependent phosphoesterase TrpH